MFELVKLTLVRLKYVSQDSKEWAMKKPSLLNSGLKKMRYPFKYFQLNLMVFY